MPMYSSGRRTGGISRGTGFGLAAPAALLAVELAVLLEAAVDDEAVAVVDDGDDGAGAEGGGVELILTIKSNAS